MVSIGNFNVNEIISGEYISYTYDVSDFSNMHILGNADGDTTIGMYWSSNTPYLSYYPEFHVITSGIPFFKNIDIKGQHLNIVYSSGSYPRDLRVSILFYK